MKVGMVLGIIGGVIALLLGLVVAAIGGAIGGAAAQFGQSGATAKSGILVASSIGLPIMAIVGSAMLPGRKPVAYLLMAVPAVALLALFSVHMLFPVVGTIIGLGAIIAWNDKDSKTGASDVG
ncbi:MAG: hypothetical protein AAGK93_06395 [Pseudomonadota bacterium]